MVVLELFAGTAGVSASVKRKGFHNAIAVDKIIPKFPKSGITKLDLTVRANQELVLDWIASPTMKAVFMSPPCGTASVARNIELPGEPNAPRPLRSLLQPDGLDDLDGTDLQRVSLANILYGFAAEVWDKCCSLGKPCMLENPSNSFFFHTTTWREREFAHCEILQHHQACAYGSTRPKWTLMVANFEEVCAINLTCPGNHRHAKWGLVQKGSKRIFATALEVHYPQALCDAISHAFILYLTNLGLAPSPLGPSTVDAKVFSGLPSASTAAPAMLPEFQTKVVSLWNGAKQLWPAQLVPLDQCKLLHSLNIGGVKVAGAQQTGLEDQCNKVLEAWFVSPIFAGSDLKDLQLSDACMLKVRGIYWTEQQFIDLAASFRHPLEPQFAMPKILVDEVDFQTQTSDVTVARERALFFKRWTQRAEELKGEEQKLKSTMDVWVAKAAGSKRLCLFREMLQCYGYIDMGVCDELESGACLIGEVETTGMLPYKFVPALSTEAMLRENARLVRSKSLRDMGSSGDPEVDQAVWTKTLEERDRGWLVGPLHVNNLEDDTPLSRRFGLVQRRGKVRLIDDYTESGINGCVTVLESPVLHTVDVACATLKYWFEKCSMSNLDPALCTRTYDLTSAYRQIGLNEHGRRYSYLRVYDPNDRCVKVFQATVLPFGAVRSVHTFLRCARALWWLGVVGCHFMWTSFYDDFIAFTKPSLVNSTQLAITAFFKLTGWLFAEEGAKCSPFGPLCEALGVVFNLECSSTGLAKVCNTASRVEELCVDIDKVLEERVLSSKTAQRLRGRMQFADAQVFGKTGRRCLRVLADFGENRRHNLTDKDCFFHKMFKQTLTADRPRVVKSSGLGNGIIFTDACYEKESRDLVCGLGGVMFTPAGDKCFFALELDSQMRDALGEQYKKQIIFEAETLATVLATLLWIDLVSKFNSFLLVDNEGCKFCLLKGLSDNNVVDLLAEIFVGIEAEKDLYVWISRVPSKSNVADRPSRGVTDFLLKDGFKDCSVDAMQILLDLICKLKRGETRADKSQLKKCA